jgi:hypothetical protein
MITRVLVILSVVAILTPTIFAQAEKSSATKKYRAKDGTRIDVVPVGKLKGYESYESRVEFYEADGRKLCSADYSSADGMHGFGVAKAEWTPDQRYFVFSMTSSGGHSVMSTPTQFFSSRDQSLCSLDSYGGELPIEFADFGLSAPNTVKVTVNGSERQVRVSLGSIDAKAPNKEHGCIPCKGGLIHEFGDKAQYEHSPN